MENLWEKFVELFELPREILLKLPLFLLVGDQNLYLENHGGIQFYGQQKLHLKVELGEVLIEGEDLTIEELDPNTIKVKGRLKRIAFLLPGGDHGCE